MEIPSRADWFIGCKGKSIFEDKDAIIQNYMKRYFSRLNQMFEYEGLPETIPKKDYLLIKQTFGSATIIKKDDKYYAVYGGLGGELNEYYHPTKSVVANPYLNVSNEYEIDKDCVVILNDIFYMGLFNICKMYAELMTECDISIRKCLLNIRIDNILESDDDGTDESIKLFFEKVKRGDFGYISSERFMDESLLKIHQCESKSNPLKDLIEMRNYIDSAWYLEFGLNANYNMKRETLTDAETQVDDKTLIPLIQDMYEQEIEGWKRVKDLFGLEVKPKLAGVWKKMYDEVMEDKTNTSDESVEDENIDNKEGDNNAEENVSN